MEYFDAYEELYSAIERFVDEHHKAPTLISVSSSLFSWIAEGKKESALLQPEESSDINSISTRYGTIPLKIDESVSPYEIIVE